MYQTKPKLAKGTVCLLSNQTEVIERDVFIHQTKPKLVNMFVLQSSETEVSEREGLYLSNETEVSEMGCFCYVSYETEVSERDDCY